jgi:hypothetical protein
MLQLDRLYPMQAALVNLSLPRVRLMEAREIWLKYTIEGFNRSGVNLVAFDGAHFSVAGFGDDSGLYLFVPVIARWFNLQLVTAANLFLLGSVALGVSVGFVGLAKYTTTRFALAFAFWQLTWFTALLCFFGDIYVFEGLVVIAIVPWLFYLLEEYNSLTSLAVFCVLVGPVIGTAFLIRGYAGGSVIILSVGLIALESGATKLHRMMAILLLLLSTCTPFLIAQHFYRERDQFLRSQPHSIVYGARHPFWHTVYIGMGFVPNSYVPGYQDKFAGDKAKELVPAAQYLSPEYESALRGEVFRIARASPLLMLEEITAKAGVILVLLLLAINFGIMYVGHESRTVKLTFGAAILFESSIGLLAIPNPKYLFGLIALAALYSVRGVERKVSSEGLRSRKCLS